MNFVEITFTKIKSQIEKFLKDQYSIADMLYSNASPFGMVLSVLENMHQMSFLYLKNTIKQFDLSDPNSLNQRIIRNAAITAGHIPGRGISATGTLKLTLKTNTDIESDVPGQRITVFNRQTLKNKTNGLNYSLNIGSDKYTFKITTNSQFFLPIIQGKWSSESFTGTGEENQTYQVTVRGNQKDIENFNVEVIVDGNIWQIKPSLYDLLSDEQACVVRTGFNNGIDIIFGNSGFGAIPSIGSLIQINYLVTDGSIGSIFRRTPNDWNFIESAIDGVGNTIDLSKIFDIQIYTDINFGADGESIQFTKNILPIVSNNFVLGLPQQFAYQIKKLGVFSHVNAYENNGVVYIVATPNINLFKNQNANYFNIDISAFSLNSYEISKINTYLKSNGNIMLSSKYQIGSPTLSYYVMNVFIITYSDAIDQTVNANIIDVISQYFLDLTRIDRIPKVDLIKQIATITDIYSVDISFICKNNEDYHKQNMINTQNKINQFTSKSNIQLSRPNPSYNPGNTIGLDPVLGDILFQPNEIPIIRGGFYDRNGVFYSDNIDDNGLKSVNIIKTGSVDVKNRNPISSN